MGDKVVHFGVVGALRHAVVLGGQGLHRPQLSGQNLQLGGVIEGLKPLESGEHIRRADAYAVIFQHGNVAAPGEDLPDLVPQVLAAGDAVDGGLHVGTDFSYRGDQVQIGDPADDGEGHQRRGMGVEHGFQVGAHFVHRSVEGQLGGGLVGTFAGAVGMDADDIPTGQRPLVHAGGSDPNIAIAVHDGQVAAGGSGQALVVNPLHKHDQLICGMDVLHVHFLFLLLWLAAFPRQADSRLL